MTRPRLLDLFCGAGGAAMGYHRAGFDVVGVDINPQPHYPFEFHQADALTYPLDGFDAIHASPPCQRFSTLSRSHGRDWARHPDLIPSTRDRLVAAGMPYVIENVPRAPLVRPVMLCGSMFDLGLDVRGEYRGLRRHRIFESPVFLWPPGPCAHLGRAIGVYGHAGGSSVRDAIWMGSLADRRIAMGIDWMGDHELAEAIPPAYTEWIGKQLLAALERAA